MGLKITSRRDTPQILIEVKFHEDFAGGGTLDITNLTKDDVIQRGVLGSFSEATRLFTVLKTFKVFEAAADDATAYKIYKAVNEQPNLAKVGDIIAVKEGGVASAITAIDNTNADYDILTVGATLGVEVAVDDALFESSEAGATAAKVKVEVNGWLREDADVDDNEFVSVGRIGTLYERRLPCAVPADVKSTVKGAIIFSQQR